MTDRNIAPSKGKPAEVRFIVQSAQEAVQKVREELGPKAKVISVRQVKGSGLGRFLAAPRLEIVATAGVVPENDEVVEISSREPLPVPVPDPLPGEDAEPSLTCRKFLEKAGLSAGLLSRLDAGKTGAGSVK